MKAFYDSFFVALLSFICIGLNAQEVKFNVTKFDAVEKLNSVDFSEIEDKYLPNLQSLEAPPVSGISYKAFLAERKKEIAKLYPQSNEPIAQTRSIVNPPSVVKIFPVLEVSTGIPCDNHLAMKGDDIVTAGNFYMAITDPNGAFKTRFTLNQLAENVGIAVQPFDPRLAYDPVADRYVLTFLAGNNSSNTHIVVAFSDTNDPTGVWHFYNLPGNPNLSNEWTDYPMISITNDNVYITINLLKDNESWQLGFLETIIWQLDKNTGYAGESLGTEMIDGITFGDTNLRNLCPAESATEALYDDVYFMSNRNFAFESDSFFMVKLDPNAGTADEKIQIQHIAADRPYGAPPNARQIQGFFQTNDARVLEAFRLDNEIQFVGNTRNLDNNKAGIYHAIIEDITDPQMVQLNHIIGPDYEIGYPGITYTGETLSDRDAIIAFNNTSENKLPGVSAMYSVPGEGYSQIVQLGQGNNYVDMLASDVERWGDYLGTQRNYADPSTVWISGLIGVGSRSNATLVGRVERPEMPTGTEETVINNESITVFPNPHADRVFLDIDIPAATKSLEVQLLNMNGQLIDQLYSSNQVTSGKNSFSFFTGDLTQGTYLVRVFLDKKEYKTKQIVKM